MRQKFNTGQEIISEDLNSLQSRLERGTYDRIIYELMGRKSNAFFKDGFLVSRISATSVQVKAGLGFQDDDTGTKDPVRKPLVLDANSNVNIDTPNSSNPRIDIICVKHNRFNAEAEDRKFKDEFTETVSTQNFTIATDWKADILYVAGVPAGSPAEPATPAGYLKIATLQVLASTGIPASGGVADDRDLLPTATGLGDTGNEQFDAIVGDLGSDQGATHADLKAALDNASDGWKILVVKDESIDTIPVVNNNKIEIVFKRGVSFTKGAAGAGLQIDGNDCKVVNGRFVDFDTAGDFGIIVSNGALRTYLDAPRFNNCDSNIDNQGTQTYTNVEYTE
jgi:hypothetical protein